MLRIIASNKNYLMDLEVVENQVSKNSEVHTLRITK